MKKRGIGFASGWQGAGYHFGHPDTSTVDLELTIDLRLRVGVAAADLGQGIPETMRIIVSKAFGGFPAERIDFIDADTAVTPDGGATGASRQTFMTGNAVLLASRKLVYLLKSAAAEMLDVSPDDVTIHGDMLSAPSGVSASLAEVADECRKTGLSLAVTATHRGGPTEELDERGQGIAVSQFSYATYVAEVEVDTDTGEVQVMRVDTFFDAGSIVNKMGAEMQIEGGVVMGLGHTLMEEFKQKQGVPETDGLSTYLIPTISDTPLEITSSFVDKPIPTSELGAKGMSELTLPPIAPAITNAIFNAVGVRVTQLPATPERVLMGIEQLRMEQSNGNSSGQQIA